jgi:chromatin structure-remodeling complex subunit RSC9
MAAGDPHEVGEGEDQAQRVEKMEPEQPGSAGRYPSRNLRQDPKRTQIYQPDNTTPRPRTMRSTNSPQPAHVQGNSSHAISDPKNPVFNIQSYEPRQPMALTLRPVLTPSSNASLFYSRKAMANAPSRTKLEPQQMLKHSIPAGSMTGPNIYLRCLYGLRSGIPEEQHFALHHLVKVSYERGDKYKFEGFPLLAESLLEKALEITDLVYGVSMEVSYNEPEHSAPENVLNAAYGTPNLLARLKALKAKVENVDDVSEENFTRLEKLNEAALVLRNMITLEENAKFIAPFWLFRDFLTIAISLPLQPRLAELRRYALDMAGWTTRYWAMDPKDPLYLSMLPHLQSLDRGLVLAALQAIVRISIELEDVFPVTGVPLPVVERLVSLVLLEADDELVESALDFLYEFTAIYDNNHEILAASPRLFPNLIPRLVALLNHNPTTTEESILSRPKAQRSATPPSIAQVPHELHQQLLQFAEPQRSARWLKCCFEESRDDDITQIAIWQAYQTRFNQNMPLAAAEFIKNVSTTFNTAQAQVINGPQPRFIIKGIKPRRLLVDLQGVPYYRCFWESERPDPSDSAKPPTKHMCSMWQSSRKSLWAHMVQDHLGVVRHPDGSFEKNAIGEYYCKWYGCMRSTAFTKATDAGTHLRSHIPESSDAMLKLINDIAGMGPEKDPEMTRHTSYYTSIDEQGTPIGISFMSVMILRNLARFANKHGAEYQQKDSKLMDRLFGNVGHELWHTFSINRTLRSWIGQLLRMIEKGEIDEKRGEKRAIDHEDE